MTAKEIPPVPLGVFRRVAGDSQAPKAYFIIKNHISFGNTPLRDVIFEWPNKNKLCVIVRKADKSWKIWNNNAYQLYVNDKLLKMEDTTTLMSGEKFRFGLDKESLTYSFHLYSKDSPVSPEEARMYNELMLKKVEAKAEKTSSKCAKLMDYLEKFKLGDEKELPICDLGKPFAGFELITSTIASSPAFYFVDKKSASFGRSVCCDFVVESKECCSVEALLQLGSLGWIISNQAPTHRLFVNDRYINNGETLIMKSGDLIRFGASTKFDMTYKFKVYTGNLPSTDMKEYSGLLLKRSREEAQKLSQTSNWLKSNKPKEKRSKAQIGAGKKVKKEPLDDSQGEIANVKEEVIDDSQLKIKLEPKEEVIDDSQLKIKLEPKEDLE